LGFPQSPHPLLRLLQPYFFFLSFFLSSAQNGKQRLRACKDLSHRSAESERHTGRSLQCYIPNSLRTLQGRNPKGAPRIPTRFRPPTNFLAFLSGSGSKA
jgi:hypothetical protein